MNSSDIIFVLQWWFVLFAIGFVFLPLTTIIFKSFFDKGYIFARILGMVLISYVAFVLGILRVLQFNQLTIFLVIFAFLILNILIFKYFKKNTFEEPIQSPRRWPNGLLRGGRWKIFLIEELLFLATLFFWSYIRAHEPSIHGLEKYMDFGFVNSILRSQHFPPVDIWFPPFPINYYYFGHLVTAVLTKISMIPSFVTYNLMLSTIFALTFTASFSIGANLTRSVILSKRSASKDPMGFFANAQNDKIKTMLAGLLSGFLVSMAGSLHAIYAFFKPYVNENPVPFWQLAFSFNTFPNSYWYPNATRFIYNTIHEFPIYSFVVSDLHGHFLDIPFVLLIIAVLLSIFYRYSRNTDQAQSAKLKMQSNNLKLKTLNFKLSFYALRFALYALLLAFMLAIMYMTNAWDGVIYFFLTILVFIYLNLKISPSKDITSKVQSAKFKVQSYILKLKVFNFELWFYALRFTLYALTIGIGFFIFTLPFNLYFKPFAAGVGILCSPEFLTNIERLGPFLFEKDHCLRSPIWQLAILYGFFYFFVIAFIVSIFPRIRMPQNGKLILVFRSLNISDIFILLLILLSTLLIIIPEFIYIKDIYPGHYRANTMFKLVYQAFMMLSIASAYIAVRLISNFKFQISNWKLVVLVFIASIGLLLVSVYPYFAINSYYNLKTYQGLDGIKYLKTQYPTDYEGILWINKNIKGQPVILEAQGDSYTDYARVSSNTGLPTVLGWAVHEWLWRGTYDIPSPRIPEVQKMYESDDLEEIKSLLKKYKVELVFFGDLERQKYPNLNEDKFKRLGKVIYQNGNTKIYSLKF